MPPEVAIIGAGPGGLASAMLLAASGARVRVYEAQPEIGGRTGRVRLGGFSFDRGPTFFLMPYLLEEVFAAAGRRLGDYVHLERLDPMYRLVIGRQGEPPVTLDATQDVEEMSRRLAALDPADGPAFERFIRENREKLRLMEPILRRHIGGPLDLASAGTARFLPHLHPLRSVSDQLAARFRSPYTRLAVSFQSKYLGMSPHDCPSLFTILPFIEYEYGVWHPTGGCHALVRAMASVCEELGVEIRTGEPVRRLGFDGRRLRRVVTDRGAHEHAHAVLNADATWALKSLIPAPLRPRWTDARIDARSYSCSTFMLYLGLEGRVDLPHHAVYISGDYQQNLRDITRGGCLSADPSVYVCNPSPLDPTLAPPACSSLYVLMPTPNTKGCIDWDAQRARARDLVLDQLESRLGIRDIRSRIRHEFVCTPADWRAQNINHGATFNLTHGLGQMLHRRVPHRMPGVAGIWFVGGATHPGSGLPVIFLSAQIGARMLCRELGLPYAADRAPSPGSRRASPRLEPVPINA